MQHVNPPLGHCDACPGHFIVNVMVNNTIRPSQDHKKNYCLGKPGNLVTMLKPVKIWVCIDTRDLSKAIQRPAYQTPTLDEILQELANAEVF